MSTSSISSSLNSFSRRLPSSKDGASRSLRSSSARRASRSFSGRLLPVAEQGGELLEVAPQQVLPEERAAPQELGQPAQGGPVAKDREVRLARHHAIEELVEGAQRARGVGGRGKEMGELLDEHHGQTEGLLIGLALDAAAVPVGDRELVAHLGPLALDSHLVHVDLAHGQGVREGVQEGGSVLASHPHQGPFGPRLVVELDGDGVDASARARPPPRPGPPRAAD